MRRCEETDKRTIWMNDDNLFCIFAQVNKQVTTPHPFGRWNDKPRIDGAFNWEIETLNFCKKFVLLHHLFVAHFISFSSQKSRSSRKYFSRRGPPIPPNRTAAKFKFLTVLCGAERRSASPARWRRRFCARGREALTTSFFRYVDKNVFLGKTFLPKNSAFVLAHVKNRTDNIMMEPLLLLFLGKVV